MKEKGHTRLVPCERLVACVIVFKTISSPVLCIFNSGASSVMFTHAQQREALGSRIDKASTSFYENELNSCSQFLVKAKLMTYSRGECS